MKITTVIALSFILSVISLNTVSAQSDEDPLTGFDDFIAELENLEPSDAKNSPVDTETTNENVFGDDFFSDLDSFIDGGGTSTTEEFQMDTSVSNTIQNIGETEIMVEEAVSPFINQRLELKVAPEGKENHILYTVPGAMEFRGMTFLNIDSSKYLNKFQSCDTAETETITNALARLKLSQGGVRGCREDQKYTFMPYKTFRTQR